MHKMLKSVPVTLMLISYIAAFSVCYSITYIVKFSPQKCGVMCLLLVFLGGGGGNDFTSFLADIFIMFVMTAFKTVLNCGETVFCEF